MPTFSIIKKKKKQVQPILGLETALAAALGFIKEHLLCAFLYVMLCCPLCRKNETKVPILGSVSPSNWRITGRASTGAHEHMEHIWHVEHRPEGQVLGVNIYRSVRGKNLQVHQRKSVRVSLLDRLGFVEIIQRELFHPKSVWIRGDIAEKQFNAYTVSF